MEDIRPVQSPPFFRWLKVLFSLLFFWTAYNGVYQPRIQTALLIAPCMLLVFVMEDPSRPKSRVRWWIELGLGGLGCASAIWFAVFRDSIIERSSLVTAVDPFAAAILILLILEACRRTVGLGLAMTALGAFVYAGVAHYMPGFLNQKSLSVAYMLSHTTLTEEGLWGVTTRVMATVVVMFLILASMFRTMGGEDFFNTVARLLLGKRGGTPHLAVIASTMVGMISGSATVNAISTGSVTIPAMIKSGYKPTFAATVEGMSSIGGQLMPPVMGMSAFLMADFTGIPYASIMLAAAVPGVIFYLATFANVQLSIWRSGVVETGTLSPASKSELLHGWPVLITVVGLVWFLVGAEYSAMRSAFLSIGLLLSGRALQALLAQSRAAWRKFMLAVVTGLREAADMTVNITPAVATAGLIIGIVNATGVTFALSEEVLHFAGGNLIVLLIVTMFASILLGTALPTAAGYIFLAILIGPALVKMGLAPIQAHMFVFYFNILAELTPPLAMVSYATASIARANPLTVSMQTFAYCIPIFLLPFGFVFRPGILLLGGPIDIIRDMFFVVIGSVGLAMAMRAYPFGNWWMRGVVLVASFMILIPEPISSLIGTAVIIVGLVIAVRGKRIAVNSVIGADGSQVG